MVNWSLMDRYQQAAFDLLSQVRATQRERITEAGRLIAEAVMGGKKIYLARVVHGIERDIIDRGGGPTFYKEYKKGETRLQAGDVLVIGSVSGRSLVDVELAYDSVEAGVCVIVLTSLAYAEAVEPVHPSGKKFHEIATLALDVCSPAAEAMLTVEGIEARFAASSGIASDFILWSITSVAVERMMETGVTPGIYKSQNFTGGPDYNDALGERTFPKGAPCDRASGGRQFPVAFRRV